MKKLFYLIGISALFLFPSCSNDEIAESVPEAKTYTPTIQGTIGEFTDANPNKTTKAGVIENNPDYATKGEQFYWHNGDKAKVLFFPDGDLNVTPIELIYTAVVANDDKSNTCDFTTTGSIPAGNYKAYALYPADRWEKDAIGYKASFPTDEFIQYNEASSKHLKDYMFMKANAGDVVITEGGDNSINLNFKHLTSVVRLHITSVNDKVSSMSIGTMGAFYIEEMSGAIFFYTSVYLENGIEGMETIPNPDSWYYNMCLYPIGEIPFTKKGSTWELDLYLPVLPTIVNTYLSKLKFQVFITTFDGEYTNYQQQNFNTEKGLSFDKELSFMPNGFEAGKSYYFNLRATTQ